MMQSLFKNLESLKELHESVHDKQTLLSILKKELTHYSVFDLMTIQTHLEQECRYLPPRYKKMFKEKMVEQLFVNYKKIISNSNFQNQELDQNQYRDFLKNFKNKLDTTNNGNGSRMIVLYYLCALYNIFITQTPPHPVGTPFPGGFFVEKIGEEYYCPVKDKQEDNDEALCRFCIAKQTDLG
jgi:uncharacterized protein (UPF0305 family)